MNKAIWKKGKKRITGRWQYIWHSDSFFIQIDGKDTETGLRRAPFEVHGEEPTFAGWKLVRSNYDN